MESLIKLLLLIRLVILIRCDILFNKSYLNTVIYGFEDTVVPIRLTETANFLKSYHSNVVESYDNMIFNSLLIGVSITLPIDKGTLYLSNKENIRIISTSVNNITAYSTASNIERLLSNNILYLPKKNLNSLNLDNSVYIKDSKQEITITKSVNINKYKQYITVFFDKVRSYNSSSNSSSIQKLFSFGMNCYEYGEIAMTPSYMEYLPHKSIIIYSNYSEVNSTLTNITDNAYNLIRQCQSQLLLRLSSNDIFKSIYLINNTISNITINYFDTAINIQRFNKYSSFDGNYNELVGYVYELNSFISDFSTLPMLISRDIGVSIQSTNIKSNEDTLYFTITLLNETSAKIYLDMSSNEVEDVIESMNYVNDASVYFSKVIFNSAGDCKYTYIIIFHQTSSYVPDEIVSNLTYKTFGYVPELLVNVSTENSDYTLYHTITVLEDGNTTSIPLNVQIFDLSIFESIFNETYSIYILPVYDTPIIYFNSLDYNNKSINIEINQSVLLSDLRIHDFDSNDGIYAITFMCYYIKLEFRNLSSYIEVIEKSYNKLNFNTDKIHIYTLEGSLYYINESISKIIVTSQENFHGNTYVNIYLSSSIDNQRQLAVGYLYIDVMSDSTYFYINIASNIISASLNISTFLPTLYIYSNYDFEINYIDLVDPFNYLNDLNSIYPSISTEWTNYYRPYVLLIQPSNYVKLLIPILYEIRLNEFVVTNYLEKLFGEVVTIEGNIESLNRMLKYIKILTYQSYNNFINITVSTKYDESKHSAFIPIEIIEKSHNIASLISSKDSNSVIFVDDNSINTALSGLFKIYSDILDSSANYELSIVCEFGEIFFPIDKFPNIISLSISSTGYLLQANSSNVNDLNELLLFVSYSPYINFTGSSKLNVLLKTKSADMEYGSSFLEYTIFISKSIEFPEISINSSNHIINSIYLSDFEFLMSNSNFPYLLNISLSCFYGSFEISYNFNQVVYITSNEIIFFALANDIINLLEQVIYNPPDNFLGYDTIYINFASIHDLNVSSSKVLVYVSTPTTMTLYCVNEISFYEDEIFVLGSNNIINLTINPQTSSGYILCMSIHTSSGHIYNNYNDLDSQYRIKVDTYSNSLNASSLNDYTIEYSVYLNRDSDIKKLIQSYLNNFIYVPAVDYNGIVTIEIDYKLDEDINLFKFCSIVLNILPVNDLPTIELTSDYSNLTVESGSSLAIRSIVIEDVDLLESINCWIDMKITCLYGSMSFLYSIPDNIYNLLIIDDGITSGTIILSSRDTFTLTNLFNMGLIKYVSPKNFSITYDLITIELDDNGFYGFNINHSISSLSIDIHISSKLIYPSLYISQYVLHGFEDDEVKLLGHISIDPGTFDSDYPVYFEMYSESGIVVNSYDYENNFYVYSDLFYYNFNGTISDTIEQLDDLTFLPYENIAFNVTIHISLYLLNDSSAISSAEMYIFLYNRADAPAISYNTVQEKFTIGSWHSMEIFNITIDDIDRRNTPSEILEYHDLTNIISIEISPGCQLNFDPNSYISDGVTVYVEEYNIKGYSSIRLVSSDDSYISAINSLIFQCNSNLFSYENLSVYINATSINLLSTAINISLSFFINMDSSLILITYPPFHVHGGYDIFGFQIVKDVKLNLPNVNNISDLQVYIGISITSDYALDILSLYPVKISLIGSGYDSNNLSNVTILYKDIDNILKYSKFTLSKYFYGSLDVFFNIAIDKSINSIKDDLVVLKSFKIMVDRIYHSVDIIKKNISIYEDEISVLPFQIIDNDVEFIKKADPSGYLDRSAGCCGLYISLSCPLQICQIYNQSSNLEFLSIDITGKYDDVLESLNQLSLKSYKNYNGLATLTLHVTNNLGSGINESVSFYVIPINDPPTVNVSSVIYLSNQEKSKIINISVSDVDSNDLKMNITVLFGSLSLLSFKNYTSLLDIIKNENFVYIAGPIFHINILLKQLIYTLPTNTINLNSDLLNVIIKDDFNEVIEMQSTIIFSSVITNISLSMNRDIFEINSYRSNSDTLQLSNENVKFYFNSINSIDYVENTCINNSRVHVSISSIKSGQLPVQTLSLSAPLPPQLQIITLYTTVPNTTINGGKITISVYQSSVKRAAVSIFYDAVSSTDYELSGDSIPEGQRIGNSIQTKLLNLFNQIGESNVSIEVTKKIIGPFISNSYYGIQWTISFINLNYHLKPLIIINQTVIDSEGNSCEVNIQALQSFEWRIGGYFTLSLGKELTTLIPANVTANGLSTVLLNLPSLFDKGVGVKRYDLGANGGFKYDITFYGIQDIPLLIVNYSMILASYKFQASNTDPAGLMYLSNYTAIVNSYAIVNTSWIQKGFGNPRTSVIETVATKSDFIIAISFLCPVNNTLIYESVGSVSFQDDYNARNGTIGPLYISTVPSIADEQHGPYPPHSQPPGSKVGESIESMIKKLELFTSYADNVKVTKSHTSEKLTSNITWTLTFIGSQYYPLKYDVIKPSYSNYNLQVSTIQNTNSISGNFQLSYGGLITNNLACDVTSYELKTELLSLSTVHNSSTKLGNIEVSRVGPNKVNGYTWYIAYIQENEISYSLIPTNVKSLLGIGARVVAYEIDSNRNINKQINLQLDNKRSFKKPQRLDDEVNSNNFGLSVSIPIPNISNMFDTYSLLEPSVYISFSGDYIHVLEALENLQYKSQNKYSGNISVVIRANLIDIPSTEAIYQFIIVINQTNYPLDINWLGYNLIGNALSSYSESLLSFQSHLSYPSSINSMTAEIQDLITFEVYEDTSTRINQYALEKYFEKSTSQLHKYDDTYNLYISDPVARSMNWIVKLSVIYGFISFNFTNTMNKELSINGSIEYINNLLDYLIYTGCSNCNGYDSLSISTNSYNNQFNMVDSGIILSSNQIYSYDNTCLYTYLCKNLSIPIHINPLRDIPEIILLPQNDSIEFFNSSIYFDGYEEYPIACEYYLSEYDHFHFGKYISISDPDYDIIVNNDYSSQSELFYVGFESINGIFTIPKTYPVKFYISEATALNNRSLDNLSNKFDDNHLYIIGRFDDVLNVIEKLYYKTYENFYGIDLVEIRVSDLSNSLITKKVIINIDQVIKPPVISNPLSKYQTSYLVGLEDTMSVIGSDCPGGITRGYIYKEQFILSCHSIYISENNVLKNRRMDRVILRSTNSYRNKLTNDILFNISFTNPTSSDKTIYYYTSTGYSNVNATLFTVNISCLHGLLTLPRLSNDIKVIYGSELLQKQIVISGEIDDINLSLGVITYIPEPNFSSINVTGVYIDYLTITVTNSNNQSSIDFIPIYVLPVNDPPYFNYSFQNSVLKCLQNDLNCYIPSIIPNDVDSTGYRNSTMTLYFTTISGSLSYKNNPIMKYLLDKAYSNLQHDYILSITFPAIYLSTALDGLFYRPAFDFVGEDIVNITLSDNKNTGICQKFLNNYTSILINDINFDSFICPLTSIISLPIMIYPKLLQLDILFSNTLNSVYMTMYEDETIELLNTTLISHIPNLYHNILYELTISSDFGLIFLSELLDNNENISLLSGGKIRNLDGLELPSYSSKSTWKLLGELPVLNSIIKSILFTPYNNLNNFNTPNDITMTFNITVHNTNVNLALPGFAVVYLSIKPINSPPIIYVPGQIYIEDPNNFGSFIAIDANEPIYISQGDNWSFKDVYIEDIDFYDYPLVSYNLSVCSFNGIFKQNELFFDRIVSFTSNDSNIIIYGNYIDVINTYIQKLVYSPDINFYGVDRINISICEKANHSDTFGLCDHRPIFITVKPVPQKPKFIFPNFPIRISSGMVMSFKTNSINLIADVRSFIFSKSPNLTQFINNPYNFDFKYFLSTNQSISNGENSVVYVSIVSQLGTISLSKIPVNLTIDDSVEILNVNRRINMYGSLVDINNALNALVYTAPINISYYYDYKLSYSSIEPIVDVISLEATQTAGDLTATASITMVVVPAIGPAPYLLLPGAKYSITNCSYTTYDMVFYTHLVRYEPSFESVCQYITSVDVHKVDEDSVTIIEGIKIVSIFSNIYSSVYPSDYYYVYVNCSYGTIYIPESIEIGLLVQTFDQHYVTIFGTLININKGLEKLTYKPNYNYYGADFINIAIQDRVFTNDYRWINHTLPIYVTPIDDRPIIITPSEVPIDLYEDETIIVTGVSIVDVDFQSIRFKSKTDSYLDNQLFVETQSVDKELHVNVTSIYGFVRVIDSRGLLYRSFTFSNTTTTLLTASLSPHWHRGFELVGRLYDINNALATLHYHPYYYYSSDFTGLLDQIDIKVYFNNNISMLVNATVLLRVHGVNNAPQIILNNYVDESIDERIDILFLYDKKRNLKPLYYTSENFPIRITDISIFDVESEYVNAFVSVTLSSYLGMITLPKESSSIVFTVGNGYNNSVISFTAPYNLVNFLLSDVIFIPSFGYHGVAAYLNILVNDLGNFGIGGPLTDNLDLHIIITPINNHPDINAPTDIIYVDEGNFVSLKEIKYNIKGLQDTNRLIVSDKSYIGNELWRLSETDIWHIANNNSFLTYGLLDKSFSQVADINPGPKSSNSRFFKVYQSSIYFQATSQLYGSELWRDTAGRNLYYNEINSLDSSIDKSGNHLATELFIDLFPGKISGNPTYLTIHKDYLYFSADGIDTTWRVNANYRDNCDSFRRSSHQSNVYFTVSADNVWNSSKVYDCPIGYRWLSTTEGYRYFTGNGNSIGNNEPKVYSDQCGWIGETWNGLERIAFLFSDSLLTNAYKHSGRPDSTRPDVDFSNYPFAGIICMEDIEYLKQSSAGRELWRTNGTQHGTIRVQDINPGISGSDPKYLVSIGNYIYFSANYMSLGRELWRSMGEVASAQLLSLPNESDGFKSGNVNSNPSYLTIVDEVSLIFNGCHVLYGCELWLIKDASNPGSTSTYHNLGFQSIVGITPTIIDIESGVDSSNPSGFETTNGKFPIYFQAATSQYGTELWTSDGTAVGTQMISDICPGSCDSNPRYLTYFKSKLYFQATDKSFGSELWVSDGTSKGTYILNDIRAGSLSSFPSFLTSMTPIEENNPYLYFFANDGSTFSNSINQVWLSDGTSTGTKRAFHQTSDDFYPDINSFDVSSPSRFGVYNHYLYFSGSSVESKYGELPSGGIQYDNYEAKQGILSSISVSDIDTPDNGNITVELSVPSGYIVIRQSVVDSTSYKHSNSTTYPSNVWSPKSLYILLAESDPTVSSLLMNQLNFLGHHVDTVSTGYEAYNSYINSLLHQGPSEQYNCIILSLNFVYSDNTNESWDGIETVRSIRFYELLQNYKNVIVIGLSDRYQNLPDVSSTFLSAGANYYMIKPETNYLHDKVLEDLNQDKILRDNEKSSFNALSLMVVKYLYSKPLSANITADLKNSPVLPAEILNILPGIIYGRTITIIGNLTIVNKILRSVFYYAPNITSNDPDLPTGELIFTITVTDTPTPCTYLLLPYEPSILYQSPFLPVSFANDLYSNISTVLNNTLPLCNSGQSNIVTSTVTLYVVAVNQPPTIEFVDVFDIFSIVRNVVTTLPRLIISDIDHLNVNKGKSSYLSTPPISVVIYTIIGRISLGYTDNIAITEGSGKNDKNVAIRGSIFDINNAINSLLYVCLTQYYGCADGAMDTVNITVCDEGFSGKGGPLSTEATLKIKLI